MKTQNATHSPAATVAPDNREKEQFQLNPRHSDPTPLNTIRTNNDTSKVSFAVPFLPFDQPETKEVSQFMKKVRPALKEAEKRLEATYPELGNLPTPYLEVVKKGTETGGFASVKVIPNDDKLGQLFNPNTIFLNIDQMKSFDPKKIEATLAHELLHTASRTMMRDIVSRKDLLLPAEKLIPLAQVLIEGTAEYFTLKAGYETPGSYEFEVDRVQQIIEAVGEDTVRAAFFKRDREATKKLIKEAERLSQYH